ncbi:MAG: fasciclin domain-containing protein, partial [Actinomycetota bacterium]
ISVRDGKVFINDSQVVVADVPASNGIVHVIDAVLLPPSITNPTPPPAAPVFEGQVLDEAEEPVPGASAYLLAKPDGRKGYSFVEATLVDGEGRYAFEVDAGCYAVVLVAPHGYTFVGSGWIFDYVQSCVDAGDVVTFDGDLVARY